MPPNLVALFYSVWQVAIGVVSYAGHLPDSLEYLKDFDISAREYDCKEGNFVNE